MSLVPKFKYPVPTLNHEKKVPYNEHPLVYNDTVTEEPFYVEYPFTFVTSDQGNTSLYKWNGNGWTLVTGWSNPEYFYGTGYFAVTTAANCYVTITEMVK
jgi:hypothetical protein